MAHKMKEKWKNLHFISTYLQHLIHSIYACVYIYENFFFVCLQVLEMVNFIAIHMNRHRRASKKKKNIEKLLYNNQLMFACIMNTIIVPSLSASFETPMWSNIQYSFLHYIFLLFLFVHVCLSLKMLYYKTRNKTTTTTEKNTWHYDKFIGILDFSIFIFPFASWFTCDI